jgi:hypothetical protein
MIWNAMDEPCPFSGERGVLMFSVQGVHARPSFAEEPVSFSTICMVYLHRSSSNQLLDYWKWLALALLVGVKPIE